MASTVINPLFPGGGNGSVSVVGGAGGSVSTSTEIGLIALVNLSSVVPNNDTTMQAMALACQQLATQLCRDWNLPVPTVYVRSASSAKRSPNEWVFSIVDTDAQVPDALAYHTEQNDDVTGYILAKTILDNGGVLLWRDEHTDTVASALFHEIAEALVDPTVNAWWQDQSGQFWAAEVCDPVQGNIVQVHVSLPAPRGHPASTVVVGLSDYVLPAWRDPESPNSATGAAKKNYLGTLTAPFTIAPGGYAVVLPAGQTQTTQIWGEKVSEAVKHSKTAASTSYKTRVHRLSDTKHARHPRRHDPSVSSSSSAASHQHHPSLSQHAATDSSTSAAAAVKRISALRQDLAARRARSVSFAAAAASAIKSSASSSDASSSHHPSGPLGAQAAAARAALYAAGQLQHQQLQAQPQPHPVIVTNIPPPTAEHPVSAAGPTHTAAPVPALQLRSMNPRNGGGAGSLRAAIGNNRNRRSAGFGGKSGSRGGVQSFGPQPF
jgi:hypothetical protein